MRACGLPILCTGYFFSSSSDLFDHMPQAGKFRTTTFTSTTKKRVNHTEWLTLKSISYQLPLRKQISEAFGVAHAVRSLSTIKQRRIVDLLAVVSFQHILFLSNLTAIHRGAGE